MAVGAVVFDIGNVLIEWHPEATFDRLIGPDRRKALFAAVDLHGMNEGVDLGKSLASSVEELAGQYPQFSREIALWRLHWIEMVSPEIPHSVRLLTALKAKSIPVFALSNFGRDTFEMAEAKYPFLELFDLRVISGVERVIKPAPAIYERLEARTDIAAHQLLFADDRLDNIEAAAVRGWQTHHFDGPKGWAARLVAEGLLSAEEAA